MWAPLASCHWGLCGRHTRDAVTTLLLVVARSHNIRRAKLHPEKHSMPPEPVTFAAEARAAAQTISLTETSVDVAVAVGTNDVDSATESDSCEIGGTGTGAAISHRTATATTAFANSETYSIHTLPPVPLALWILILRKLHTWEIGGF
jgi:hypothetical protein